MRSFDDLRAIALGAVDVLTGIDKDLVVIVVVADNGAGARGRFACESNVRRGADVARVCRDVAVAIENVS